MTKYIDEHGLVHMLTWEKTENGILFRAYLDWLKVLNDRAFIAKDYIPILNTMIKVPGGYWYQANPPEMGPHFSRDNMWGLYCKMLMAFPSRVSRLPIFKWNDRIWWHPNGWMVFLSLKYKVAKAFFALPIFLMYAVSVWKHRDPVNSSGSCLWSMMNYFLWGILPDEYDIEKFRQYISKNGEYDQYHYNDGKHPIMLELDRYEGLER